MSVPDPTLLSIRDLRVDFRISRTETLTALKGVSFDIPANTTVALVGESGSGKSVTGLAIMGLLPRENALLARASKIVYRGDDLTQLKPRAWQQLRGREISMIFQEPMSSLNPVFTIGFQLAESLIAHLDMSHTQATARAIELLREVGIPNAEQRVNAYPFELSGGQQQRVMIAIALACEPKLLIADEPTTALDVTIQKQILDLLAELKERRQMSVLFITHDLAIVGEIADNVVVMRAGEIREQGSARQIFEQPQDAYTKALLLCRPQLDRRPARLPTIDDFLDGLPRGKAFEERERGLRGDEPIVLAVQHLAKTFYISTGVLAKKAFKAVDDVSFTLARGKTIGLVGESGSGKTTVGLTLLRLHEASGGKVLFDGKDMLTLPSDEALRYKRRVQIVFQNPYSSLNPRFTIGQILSEPMYIHRIGADERARREMAYELLEKVGLPASAYARYPHEFSGGQRQRIAVARCLTMKPDVLICDESVSALDVSVQAQILNLLQDLQDEYAMSYIFISHDLAVVKYMADQVIVMKDGRIVEIADSDEIYRNPQHPYTKQLLSAIPWGWRTPAAI